MRWRMQKDTRDADRQIASATKSAIKCCTDAGLFHLSATPSFHLWTMLTRHAKKDTKITLKIEFAYVSVCECHRQGEGEEERAREIEMR